MSISLRIALIIGAAIMLALVLARTRKAKIQSTDAIFWIILAVVFVVLAVFPGIGMSLAQALQVESPANFIFLVIIAVLVVKQFLSDMEISQLKTKLSQIAQEIALKEHK